MKSSFKFRSAWCLPTLWFDFFEAFIWWHFSISLLIFEHYSPNVNYTWMLRANLFGLSLVLFQYLNMYFFSSLIIFYSYSTYLPLAFTSEIIYERINIPCGFWICFFCSFFITNMFRVLLSRRTGNGQSHQPLYIFYFGSNFHSAP